MREDGLWFASEALDGRFYELIDRSPLRRLSVLAPSKFELLCRILQLLVQKTVRYFT